MIHWDPRPEVFTIPYLNWPVLWYGVLFTLGFVGGFFLFVFILIRYFFNEPDYVESDILRPEKLLHLGRTKSSIAHVLNLRIAKEEIRGSTEQLERQVLKSRCLHPKRALCRLILDREIGSSVLTLKKKAFSLADRLTVYMVVATIVGARLGHFIFYETPSTYLQNPWEILQIWKGGLASHGAVIAIVVALVLFSYRMREKVRDLSWLRLLDFISVPAALVGCFIRIGNFFNQEILGTETSLPWGIVFGHPADDSSPLPRHPAQLYEALFYLAIFAFLWNLSHRPRFLLSEGKLAGLFLILVFGFRFLVEFLKVEQSHLLPFPFPLTMGQLLSLPMILCGFFFYTERD